jgi:hypothetical protein
LSFHKFPFYSLIEQPPTLFKKAVCSRRAEALMLANCPGIDEKRGKILASALK